MRKEILIEILGISVVIPSSLILLIATVCQQFMPNNSYTFMWNIYGEGTIEFIGALITIPCALYYFKVSIKSLLERWR